MPGKGFGPVEMLAEGKENVKCLVKEGSYKYHNSLVKHLCVFSFLLVT